MDECWKFTLVSVLCLIAFLVLKIGDKDFELALIFGLSAFIGIASYMIISHSERQHQLSPSAKMFNSKGFWFILLGLGVISLTSLSFFLYENDPIKRILILFGVIIGYGIYSILMIKLLFDVEKPFCDQIQKVVTTAHDIKIPLSSIILNIRGYKFDDERRSQVLSNLQRIRDLANSWVEKPNWKTLDLIDFLKTYQGPLPCHIDSSCLNAGDQTFFDPLELTRVFDSLAMNAGEAGAKHLQVKVFKDEKSFLLEVSNDGAPITHEISKNLFRARCTSKGTNRGFGLLGIKFIVEKNAGSIELKRSEKFTTFVLKIPSLSNGSKTSFDKISNLFH